MILKRIILLLGCLCGGCLGYPQQVQPVQNFELSRYLGQWYEIARLDHPFERGLSHVTAHYRLRPDGGIEVINRGYSASNQEHKQATGKAYFVGEPNEGYLKVSFWGPFYSSYVIFELDDDYQYAFVCSHSPEYLWLLARRPQIDDSVLQQFYRRAGLLGVKRDQLIFPDHSLLTSDTIPKHGYDHY